MVTLKLELAKRLSRAVTTLDIGHRMDLRTTGMLALSSLVDY
jgi:hypothetical protein